MSLNCPHAWEEYKKLDTTYDALRREYLALREEQSSDNSNEFKNVSKEWLLRMREFRGRCLPFRAEMNSFFQEFDEMYNSNEFEGIRLQNLQKKIANNIELSKRDLRFLYSVDDWPYDGWSYNENEKILDEIIETRNKRKDLSKALDCREDQISFTNDDFEKGKDIVYHWGNLDLSNKNDVGNLQLPQYIRGNLKLNGLLSIDGLKLPKRIFGYFSLGKLKSVEGADFSDCIIEGQLYVGRLSFSDQDKLRDKFPNIADNILYTI